MNKLILIAAMLLASSCYSQIEKLDEKNGFKRFIFGTPLDSVKGIEPIGKDKEYYMLSFKGRVDTLKIGDYKFNSLMFKFYKGRLALVTFQTTSYVDAMGILQIMTNAYGNPERKNDYSHEYYWSGKKVRMSLTYEEITGKGRVTIVDAVAQDAEINERKEKEKKAVDDL